MIIMIQMEQATNEMLLCHRGGGTFHLTFWRKNLLLLAPTGALEFILVFYRSTAKPFFKISHLQSAIFFKSIGFKDIKYDIPVCHEDHECHEYKNTKCSNDPFVLYF